MRRARLWLAYAAYRRRWGMWPSRLQRLFMQGDPNGEVKRTADQILSELREEDDSDHGQRRRDQ